MSTGGTLPIGRTQHVTFYNTTGVIEQHKNIYLAPRLSQHQVVAVGDTVSTAYLKIFNSLITSPSAYTDIEISQWSPEDRTLRIKGNVDDFRTTTEEGHSLNYFILKREIQKSENDVETHYYGFFITKATQAGSGSVTLQYVPDNFTNVFYLHNKKVLSETDIISDYEPFNERMKNCYVNRQHYDRIKLTELVLQETIHITAGSGRKAIQFNLPEGEVITHAEFSHDSGIHTSNARRFYNVVQFTYVTQTEGDYTFTLTLQCIESANLNKFLNTEESFRFKYQYRDMRKILSMYSFNTIDIEYFRNLNYLDFTVEDAKRLIELCTCFLVIQTREPIEAILKEGNNPKFKQPNNYLLKNSDLSTNSFIYLMPFIYFPENLGETMDTVIKDWLLDKVQIFGYNIGKTARTNYSEVGQGYYSWEGDWIETMGDYILSLNIIPITDISCDIYVDNSQPNPTYPEPQKLGGVVFNSLGRDITRGEDGSSLVYVAPTPAFIPEENYQQQEAFITVRLDDNGNYVSTNTGLPLVRVSNQKMIDKNLTLYQKVKNPKNNFFDNLLETEPYSFYSISFNRNETVLKRDRFYQSEDLNYATVKISMALTFNETVYYSLIPNYSLNGIETKYFNESLSFTVAYNIPIKVGSLESYYFRNMSQLKNQYDVNNYQRGTDLAQTFFNTAPAQVGAGFISGGKQGGFSQLVKQVSGMIDNAIDWAQSDKVIQMNQKSKLADVGRQPDTISNTSSEAYDNLVIGEPFFYLNHYTIDTESYNTIAKFLERFGYQIRLYDTLHTMDRVGWNFIELESFDYEATITVEQEESIRQIFKEGVTLLHDGSYLSSGHNYETLLEEVI